MYCEHLLIYILLFIFPVLHLTLTCTLQGYGTNYYSTDEYYEGEWYAGKRSGWGRMYYSDGSVYEGEWYNDQRHGNGLLRLGILC